MFAKSDVCRHEAGHFTIGIVNSLRMGAILVVAGEVGHGGLTWYGEAFDDLTTEDEIRAAVRTCLAGEVARTGANDIAAFAEGAADDIEHARALARRVGADTEDIISTELAAVIEQVEQHAQRISDLTETLLETPENENGHFGLGSIEVARSIGYVPMSDEHGTIVGFLAEEDEQT